MKCFIQKFPEINGISEMDLLIQRVCDKMGKNPFICKHVFNNINWWIVDSSPRRICFQTLKWPPKIEGVTEKSKASRGSFSTPDLAKQAEKGLTKSSATVPLIYTYEIDTVLSAHGKEAILQMLFSLKKCIYLCCHHKVYTVQYFLTLSFLFLPWGHFSACLINTCKWI